MVACGTAHDGMPPASPSPLTSSAIEPMEPAPPPSLDTLLTATGAGSDPVFARFLERDGQRASHTSPLALRQLLGELDVFRTSFEQGYLSRGGRPVLYWWLDDLSVRGGVDDVRKAVILALTARGFDQVAREGGMAFEHAGGGTVQRVRIDGPEPYTGGTGPACGMGLSWEVISDSPAPQPTLQSVLKALPVLSDERVDPAICDFLRQQPLASLSAGGTHERFYDWSVTISSDEPEELLVDLGEVLEAQGFHREGDRYRRAKTGSYAWLRAEEDSVHLRLRPQS